MIRVAIVEDDAEVQGVLPVSYTHLALRTQLNSGDRKELSRAERRQQLLTRLLSEQEPCKTAVLARALSLIHISDMNMAAIICAAFAILTDASAETALALAIPIAVLGQMLGCLLYTSRCV